jgi:hypothetical protein
MTIIARQCGAASPMPSSSSQTKHRSDHCTDQARGVALSPHVVAVDSGSTDSGPQKLGLGSMTRSREAYVKDISLILRQAVPKRMSCWRRPVCHALPLVHTHSTARKRAGHDARLLPQEWLRSRVGLQKLVNKDRHDPFRSDADGPFVASIAKSGGNAYWSVAS